MEHLSVVSQDATMTSSSIAEILGKEKKEVNRLIRSMFEDKIDGVDSPPCIYVEKDSRGYVIEYHVPELESKMFVAKFDINYLEQITQFWIENANKDIVQILPEDFASACRQLADKHEQLQFAIATKAEIGNRREATSMNTASQAVKKANKLEVELDKSKEYCSIKRMQMLYHGQKFNWRMLRSIGSEMGIPSIDIFDANYGTVKAYHNDVWLETYGIEVE